MKKNLLSVFCLSLLLVFAGGCSTEEITQRFLPSSGKEPEGSPEVKERVYMDKVTGVLTGFDGTNVSVKDASDLSYTFDASEATIECAAGVISGDEISVIYEGQLSGTDTSGVKVLKIVDELHTKQKLPEQTKSVTLNALTNNTIQFTDPEGGVYLCTSTGAAAYFENGAREGLQVYIHYIGEFPAPGNDSSVPVQAPLIKILSISDVEPLTPPDTSKMVPPAGEEIAEENTAPEEASPEGAEVTVTPAPPTVRAKTVSEYAKIRGHLMDAGLSGIKFVPNGESGSVETDISSVPAYFPGGFMTGAAIELYYTGEQYDSTSLSGIAPVFLEGDDPEQIRREKAVSYVAGTVIGQTQDTVTVRTDDGAMVILSKASLSNKYEDGDRLEEVMNPAVTGRSNILRR